MVNRKEYYLSESGCNSNAGGICSPIKSLERAVELLGESDRNYDGEYEEVIFFLREGEYYIEKPLILTNKHIKYSRIVFSNYENETVKVYASRKLNTEWQIYSSGIYFSYIGREPDFDILFADGEPQILCRYPDYYPDDILDGCSPDALSAERIAGWRDPSGGYVRALHDNNWGGNSYKIIGKAADGSLNLEWVGDNNRGSGFDADKVVVENIFEELDSEREWFYDKETGNLFYYPSAGKDINEMKFEGAFLDNIITFKGDSPQKTVGNIIIRGIEFSRTSRTLFKYNYERPLRGDWAIQRIGLIYMENGENIELHNCRFYDTGGNAVMMSGYNSGHIVDSCDFENIGATGVLICGYQTAVRDSSTWDDNNHKTVISDYTAGPLTEAYPRKIVISNNYFTRNGIWEKQTAAICISIAEFITVSGNTIHHMPRAGININDGCFGGHVIEKNDLFDCVRETGDHGPFNSWGRDRFWSLGGFDTVGKNGEMKRPAARLDARSTNIIRNNRIHGLHAFGIDLDDGSTNYEIYNNLCLGAGIKTREGFDRIVYNNILIGCPFEVHVSYAMNNDLFYNNIVYNEKPFNYILLNEGCTTIITNNFYWNGTEAIKDIFPIEKNYLIKDPLFENPDKNNYAVKQTEVLKRGFANFPVSDIDFGRPEKPKPPTYIYQPMVSDHEIYTFRGIQISDIYSEGIKSAAGLPDYNGAMIMTMEETSEFIILGFMVSDVIRKINGTDIINAKGFIEEFSKINKGEIIKRRIIKRKQFEVEIVRNQCIMIIPMGVN